MLLLFLFKNVSVFAQELQADVRVISDKIQQSNRSIFLDLERSMKVLLNQTQWSQSGFQQRENVIKVVCNFVLTIDKMTSDKDFSATLSVQASRQVFNSLYQTPIFNYREEGINFSYIQGENLNYNANAYTSELTSLVAFYTYMILGIYADTMQDRGGDVFFGQAQRVQGIAAISGLGAWLPGSGANNRYWLLDNWLSPLYKEIRKVYYLYHRKGLDQMHYSLVEGIKPIEDAISMLQHHATRRSNSVPLQVFMEAKAYEISQIFGGQLDQDAKREMKNRLEGFYPAKSNVWALIR